MSQCLNRKVHFLAQMDFAQSVTRHENPCDTRMQPQSKNRTKNRKKFLMDSHICEDPSVTGLQPHPEKLICEPHNHVEETSQSRLPVGALFKREHSMPPVGAV